uniref:Sulfatase N-terminal domain-containing protein n=1 Tax=Oryctolagus cuniculus TaxID=9986 RepID=G1U4T2_RABIT
IQGHTNTATTAPNSVLLLANDLGIGDLGSYGNRTLRSDIRVSRHLAAAPLCTPGSQPDWTLPGALRSVVHGGMAAQSRVGVFLFPASSGGLPATEVTFARLAKARGYTTAIVGKWHLGLSCRHPRDFCHHLQVHGFDQFFGLPTTNLRDCKLGAGTVFEGPGCRCSDPGRPALPRLGPLPPAAFLGLLLPVVILLGGHFLFRRYFWPLHCFLMCDFEVAQQPLDYGNLTQRLTEEATGFIRWNSQKPFLLLLSYIHVHTALFASPEFAHRSWHGAYGDTVEELDWSVGRILQVLDKLGLAGCTLVYFSSDQGAHVEEVMATGEVHGGSNGIYRGGKANNWEGGIWVLGILCWPGVIPAGCEVDAATSNMDIFPTVAELTGALLPHSPRVIDGWDLMLLLWGQSQRLAHEFLFHYCNAYLQAVRWLAVMDPGACWIEVDVSPFRPAGANSCFPTHVCLCQGPTHMTSYDPPLLFNLARDPGEAAPLTPHTEPHHQAILGAILEVVAEHRGSVSNVPNQLAPHGLEAMPWLCRMEQGSGVALRGSSGAQVETPGLLEQLSVTEKPCCQSLHSRVSPWH